MDLWNIGVMGLGIPLCAMLLALGLSKASRYGEGMEKNLKEYKKKSKKVTFYGLFGQGNLGNECTLQAIIYNTRKYFPDAELSCICYRPRKAKVIHNMSTFPIRGLPDKVWSDQDSPALRLLRRAFIGIPMRLVYLVRSLKMLMRTDVLVVPGTGFLSDAYTSSFGWPYDIFIWSLMAKLCRCRLFYVSVGAGPLYHSLSKWFIKLALSLADFRSYRDNSTIEYLRDVGLATNNDRVYPDLAFSLADAAAPQVDSCKRHRPVVGIGLMSDPGRLIVENPTSGMYLNYLHKLVIVGKWLLARGYEIRLLIGDVQDKTATQEFKRLMKEHTGICNEGQSVDEPVFSVEDLLLQLAATDAVVATRFHNILLALLLNKPVISICFHHKCASLMSNMGLSEYCQDINNLDSDRLIEQFCDLERNAEKLRPLIRQKREEFRKALDEQYNFIFNDMWRE